MKTLEALDVIPPAFAPSSLRQLVAEDVAAVGVSNDGLVLVGTGGGDLVLVDREGNELHRLAAPQPVHNFGDTRLISAIATNGNRFAASVVTHVVIGEVSERELRVVAKSKPFRDLVDHVAFVEGGIRARLADQSSHLLGLDGSMERTTGDGGTKRKKKSKADSEVAAKLAEAHEGLVAVQDECSDVGAADTENDEAIVDALRRAAEPDSDDLPEVFWSLFEDRKQYAEAREKLDAAAKGLLALVRAAAKKKSPALETFLEEQGISLEAPLATVPDEEASGAADTYPRSGSLDLNALSTGDGKIILWPFPSAVRDDANPSDGGAWILDEQDFSESAYDRGGRILHAGDGESVFVVHSAYVERIDISSEARQTIHRCKSKAAKMSRGGRIVLETWDETVSILDPRTQQAKEFESATLIEGGIVETKGNRCRVRDLDGQVILELSQQRVAGAVDASTKTVAAMSDDYDKLHVYRAGKHSPLYTFKGLLTPYLTNGVLVAEKPGETGVVVNVVDLETGAKREVRNAKFESDVAPVRDGIAWAFVSDENDLTKPQLMALSKDDVTVGPEYAAPPENVSADDCRSKIFAIGEGFIVVGIGMYRTVLQVVDAATLAPIGDPITRPFEPVAISTLRDEFAVLYLDGSVARHRVVG
ncbi:hypothetical protein AKJ09_11482 [Labilithrix luteola]|uniref:Uncharacterized protein n=1 Tax=Labilithrix luteola TaxID=1391654 RepID=A0A0K1QGC6_9BACT|nr:hypothetical protein [Labilithrix luteola]AKV04819.1 hypothetical protein AKJ09_11482 [Labilithrix luteola]